MWSDASEAIQVYLLILDHVLQYSGRKAVNGLGFGLIAFTDQLKTEITTRNYSHSSQPLTETPLTTTEFQV